MLLTDFFLASAFWSFILVVEDGKVKTENRKQRKCSDRSIFNPSPLFVFQLKLDGFLIAFFFFCSTSFHNARRWDETITKMTWTNYLQPFSHKNNFWFMFNLAFPPFLTNEWANECRWKRKLDFWLLFGSLVTRDEAT